MIIQKVDLMLRLLVVIPLNQQENHLTLLVYAIHLIWLKPEAFLLTFIVNHHKNVGKTVQEWQEKGCCLHSYAIAGSPTAVNHYLLFEKGE